MSSTERDPWPCEPVDVSELRKLSGMLTDAGVPHEWHDLPEMGGAMLKIPGMEAWLDYEAPAISVIQYAHSYGGDEGLVEVWRRPKDSEPVGWLTAREAFKRIKEVWIDGIK